ncbi:hypothetical protein EV368DRAFT_69822 [Lentinula lateritia]|nr:hypothetical protein EV368DRAFT_69822 [Lentinula lateritia]
MITGAEFSLIFVVARKLKSEFRSTSTIRKETEAILNNQQLVELLGTKFILVRHINIRNAYSLAKLYEEEVRRNTTDAQIQALRDKAKDLLKQQRNRRKKANEGKGEEEAPTRGLPTHYLVQSPSLTTFAYPRVGSTPTVPEGFKFGTLAFYEALHSFCGLYPSQVVTDFANLEGIDLEDDHFVPIASSGNMPSSNHTAKRSLIERAIREQRRSCYEGHD